MAAVVAVFGCVPAAFAGVRIETIPTVAPNVSLGSTGVAASLEIKNTSFNGLTESEYQLDTFRVDDITVVLSCGSQIEGADCQMGSKDPGVLVPSPLTATGRTGTACDSRTFTLADIDMTQGKYRFTPNAQVTLGASSGSPALAHCIIDFTVSVARMPTIDADPGTAGPQTAQLANAAVTDLNSTPSSPNGGQIGSDFGTSRTTVTRAVTAIATTASADITLGSGTLVDSATVSGRVSAVAGATVDFRLYGPDDATCAGPPVFSSSVPYPAAGGAVTSAPFTPAEVGTYRWTAAYSGDVNNLAAAAGCNAPGESVAVTAPATTTTPPPPPPPPPPAADGPQILSATFDGTPRVGSTTFLVVRAVDPLNPISGMQVRFGEPRGQSGLSACAVSALGLSLAPTTLRLPYVFTTPGKHTVTIEVMSGDCDGALRRTVTTIEIDVAPGASARQAFSTAQRAFTGGGSVAAAAKAKTIKAKAKAKACKDALLIATAANRSRIEAAVLCLVNAERRKKGRKKLLRSSRLQKASIAHSEDMFSRRYFEHERVPGGPKLKSRLTKTGYRGRTYAENIGYGSNFDATLMVRAWMNSPPHKANILHPRLKFAGVGTALGLPNSPARPGTTFTMNFGATLR